MSINALLSQRWRFCHQPLNWRQAIHLASQPLINEHKINAHYPLYIIDALKQDSSAFIVEQGVMMVYARPEHGVISKRGEAAILKCEKPVTLPNGNKVNTIIVVSAGDSQEQMQIRQQVVSWVNQKRHGAHFTHSASQSMLNNRIKAELSVH